MKYLFSLLLCFFFLSCGVTPPQVTKTDGDKTYGSIIGTTWYCNENLASWFDDFTYSSHCCEKWQFYADSIVVIATHFTNDSIATYQYKYVAELSQMDRIWDSNGETWRTTTSYWKQYTRGSGCDWAEMFSFCTGPYNLIVNNWSADTIGFGDYEVDGYYHLTKTPTHLSYLADWIGFACGYTIQ